MPPHSAAFAAGQHLVQATRPHRGSRSPVRCASPPWQAAPVNVDRAAQEHTSSTFWGGAQSQARQSFTSCPTGIEDARHAAKRLGVSPPPGYSSHGQLPCGLSTQVMQTSPVAGAPRAVSPTLPRTGALSYYHPPPRQLEAAKLGAVGDGRMVPLASPRRMAAESRPVSAARVLVELEGSLADEDMLRASINNQRSRAREQAAHVSSLRQRIEELRRRSEGLDLLAPRLTAMEQHAGPSVRSPFTPTAQGEEEVYVEEHQSASSAISIEAALLRVSSIGDLQQQIASLEAELAARNMQVKALREELRALDSGR